LYGFENSYFTSTPKIEVVETPQKLVPTNKTTALAILFRYMPIIPTIDLISIYIFEIDYYVYGPKHTHTQISGSALHCPSPG
jgi:hypothetical protein